MTAPTPTPAGLYVGGAFRAGRGEPLDVVDPATGQRITTLHGADDRDVADALHAAHDAAALWRAVPAWTRSEMLREVAWRVRSSADAIADTLTAEQGKPRAQARAEVATAADQFDWHADEARRIYGRTVDARTTDDRIVVRREPIGVVAAFTPWNFPALLPARKLSAALAAGCPVILKPAEEAPLTALALAAACDDAGIPPGVVAVLVGDPLAISTQLIDSSVVRKVSLTGSVPVGRELMTRAAAAPKPISLELGGHAPVVVFDDVEPVRAGIACAEAKFRNAGQVCIAASRFIVAAAIAERFTAAFVGRTSRMLLGHGGDPATDVGPLTNARRVDAVEALVEDATARGARVACGGRRPPDRTAGHWYEPTVLTRVPADAAVLHTEPFGPVAPITTFRTFDEAIALANATNYGLAGYVLTGDLARATHAAERLDVGMVGINNFAIATAEAPFGGVKASGFGREGGSEGIADYLVTKYVNVRLGEPV